MSRVSLKNTNNNTTTKAKPFLKWAGGKVQLLTQFRQYYPQALQADELTRYIEPFLGGGAVFLDVAQRFPSIQSAYLFDINEQLVLAYQVIKHDPDTLIENLSKLSGEYFELHDSERKELYYDIRSRYNQEHHSLDYRHYSKSWIQRAAKMLFLNKTCYNGLFRVNRKGEFNVPYGKYKKPRILDRENILRVAELLQKAEICLGDFTKSEDAVTDESFVYFDPPYRPISKTSSFTSYAKHVFDDGEQVRLGEYYRTLAQTYQAKLMLSNSDPKNENEEDHFFEELYHGFKIKRVNANRMINSNPQKRGQITELLVLNYSTSQ